MTKKTATFGDKSERNDNEELEEILEEAPPELKKIISQTFSAGFIQAFLLL